MLNILRKYQKFIYALVTGIIVVSFSFFGTYSALMQKSGRVDRLLGKGIDGAKVMKSEIDHLVSMLNTDSQDLMVFENKGMPNLLNEGVVRKQLIQRGLLRDLFEAYQDEIAGELQERVVRFTKFKPYVHPDRMIGVEKVLEQFMPAYAADYQKFKLSKGGADGSMVALLGELYKNQATFPPQVLRQILLFQQNQFAKSVRPDPNLTEGDLSFFYAKSLTDWFGPKFVHVIGQFVHNAAVYAKQHGYEVSKEEAKSALMQVGMDNLQMLQREKRVTTQEFQDFYQKQLRILGMTEAEAVSAWQKVTLFKKLFKDVEEGVCIDSKLYKEFHGFASKGVKVDLYRLPKSLEMRSSGDLEKLEVYLNLVTQNSEEAMSTKFLPAREVMKKAPELVWKRFVVKVSKVTRKEIEDQVGLRNTWNWEIEDRNWEVLSEKFALLAKSQLTEREKRFSYLESLDQKTRGEIDNFARMRMVKENPEWIKEELSKAEPSVKELRILLEGDDEILSGVKDRTRMLSLLERAALQSEDREDSSREELYNYSEDGNVFYRIQICERQEDFEVISFEQAKTKKILDRLVEKKKPTKVDLDRLVFYMQDMRKKVLLDQDVLAQSRLKGAQGGERLEQMDPLEEQWRIEKEELSITRKMNHPLFSEDLFMEGQNEWSQVMQDKAGNPYFYHIKGQFVDLDPVAKGMEEGRKLLGKEAVRGLMANILSEMKAKKVISFTSGDDGSQDTASD